jgi:hypothetical protein
MKYLINSRAMNWFPFPAMIRASLCIGALLLIGDAKKVMALDYAMTVNNIAELQSLNTSSLGNTNGFLVLGYYSPGDRGGGVFQWTPNSTATPDGGRYLASSNLNSTPGRWIRMLNGEVANVKMWGAVGNRQAWLTNADQLAHDDTVSIQNAVNAVGWGWTSELLIPSGAYMVTNTIYFPSQIHIHGDGTGNNTSVTMPIGVNKDIFVTLNAQNYRNGQAYDWDHGLLFDNIIVEFEGDFSKSYDEANRNVTNAALVMCRPGEAMEVQHCVFNNGGYGIRVLGGGAPGLRADFCSCFGQAIGGISVEAIPSDSGGGSMHLTGLSGDYRWASHSDTACFVRFYNVTPDVDIVNLKAEGEWGGGLVQQTPIPGAELGAINIEGGTYNSGPLPSQPNNPRDVVVLKYPGTPVMSTPVYVHGMNLYGVRYLIRDELTGRNVETDVTVSTGANQCAAKIPIIYTSSTYNSRLVKGQTAFSYLYPTNAGWYRIMSANWGTHLSGKLDITTEDDESVALEFDVATWGGPQSSWISCPRTSYGSAVVTQARAYQYWDNTAGGIIKNLDVYIANPPTNGYFPIERRVTFCHDLNGVEGLDTDATFLMGNILPVSATLPSGVVSSNIVSTVRGF